jgi:Uma2 family endonuclease
MPSKSRQANLVLEHEERPCRVSSSDLRIDVEAVGLATFPDGSVICGPLQQHPPSPDATALNPMILLEVTSDSSEEYDTGAKLEAYKTIPTLREVVLVSHRERRITVHRRDTTGAWVMRVAIAGGRVAVESLGAELTSTRSTATPRSRKLAGIAVSAVSRQPLESAAHGSRTVPRGQ